MYKGSSSTTQELLQVVSHVHTCGVHTRLLMPSQQFPVQARDQQQLYEPFRVNIKYETFTVSSRQTNFPSKGVLVHFTILLHKQTNAHFLDTRTGKALTAFYRQQFPIHCWCHVTAEVPSLPRAQHSVRPSQKATCSTLTAIIYCLGLSHGMGPG